VDRIINKNQGSAQTQEGVSLQTFLASLSVAAVVFGVEVLLFVLLRKKMKRVYEPRTYLVSEKCVLAPPSPLLTRRWSLADLIATDGELHHQLLAFLTFLHLCVRTLQS